MAYPATTVAKFVLAYCTEQKHSISNLKLQKILYFLWIDFYKKIGIELFEDEICAWQLGPVIPAVYYEYCSYAGTPIFVEKYPEIDDSDSLTLKKIINKYIIVSASTLVNKTHQQGKPWNVVYKDGRGNRDVIPFSLIKSLECDC